MIVRFGYVAMSTIIKNASPSRTMTYTHFAKLEDREAGLHRLTRIAEENLNNTLRLLKHNRASDIHLYRMSSKLIPLATHQELQDWDPFPYLAPAFQAIGDYAKQAGIRLSFHPDHFTVLSTPREEVLHNSIRDLAHHVRMLEAMGMDEHAKNNIHIGGAYGDKKTAGERFIHNFLALTPRIQRRLTLENDDKTFNAVETLEVSEKLGVPMVLDIHHQWVNNEGEAPMELWPRIQATWKEAHSTLPPKIHVSSPKSEKDIRGHADYVDIEPLLAFLRGIAASETHVDVMIEAKMKDEALFKLMEDMKSRVHEGVHIVDQATVEIEP
ncbi:UV damage endonuclease UvsE [Paenibacillus selenitireducens]|uniref:UV damage endonuclease UvsE n=1 Tax=Paenibacillus selenitireducens TaxID=1324314 RepID=A0A1T2X7F9_9BACL|nr:UV DNA damage repair endonuclease UvsE [Paenibacillus selenitireducens]OPA75804.1 UV damage endonuclease UvsE [Paenibacillus selenitireducens]